MTGFSRSEKIGIIDYGAGNIGSVSNAIRYLGFTPFIIDKPELLDKASKVIFPGVGAFGSVMAMLKTKEMDKALMGLISEGKPFLGICLGYQILFERSEETKNLSSAPLDREKGLGVFEGDVVRFNSGKIPQIGWNEVVPTPSSDFIPKDFYYFVNSYYPVPRDRSIIAGKTQYGSVTFASAIKSENVFATQFHPEKSGIPGLLLLKRWLTQC